MREKKLIVIAGPTASGKTALGITLAGRVNGEIVSADSMQIYRGMDVGTAKATAEEQTAAKHHMLDLIEPGENYSVSRYVEDATRVCEDLFRRGKKPIVVGGTGLYIDALLAGSWLVESHAAVDARRRRGRKRGEDFHGRLRRARGAGAGMAGEPVRDGGCDGAAKAARIRAKIASKGSSRTLPKERFTNSQGCTSPDAPT